MKLYYATIENRRLNLVVLEVEEKEKSYRVKSEKPIVGMATWRKVFPKNELGLFGTLLGALEYAELKSLSNLDDIREKLQQAEKETKEIQKTLAVVRANPEKVESALEAK